MVVLSALSLSGLALSSVTLAQTGDSGGSFGPTPTPTPQPAVSWPVGDPGVREWHSHQHVHRHSGEADQRIDATAPPQVKRSLGEWGYPLGDGAAFSAGGDTGSGAGVRAKIQTPDVIPDTTSVRIALPGQGRYVGDMEIYRDGGRIAVFQAGQSVFIDSGLRPNTHYTYQVIGALGDGTTETTPYAVTTLAAVPKVALPMSRTGTSLLLPIVDLENPDYTEYRAEMWPHGSSDAPIIRDWSTERCISMNGLVPQQRYQMRVHARNLDSIETDSPESIAGESGGGWLTVYTKPGTFRNDAWARREVAAAKEIYGLTDAAYQWLLEDIEIVRMRGEPGWAGATERRIGIGHPDPWVFMHEAMHVFWSYWAGFPESCDRMNLHTFRRDLLDFRYTFHALDNEELDNPLEPWRSYYDALDRSLPDVVGGERVQDIAANEEFGKLWHHVFHVHETNSPMYAMRKPAILPPSLRRYFDGFLLGREGGDMTEENLRGRFLAGTDRALWDMAYGRFGVPLPTWVSRVSDALRTGSLDESERELLQAAHRQKLVDFFNTLPDVADNGYLSGSDNPDCRFGRDYVRQHMELTGLYAGELREAEGMELAETELASVLRAWAAFLDNPLYSEQHLADVRAAINAEADLPARYQDAMLEVVELIRRHEFRNFTPRPRPNFNIDAPFGDPVLVTEPKTVSSGGLQDVVLQVDRQDRVRLEWGLPAEAPQTNYRSNFSDGCWGTNYLYEWDSPAILDSGRRRVTWEPNPPGTYQFCVDLAGAGEVCHGNIVLAP